MHPGSTRLQATMGQHYHWKGIEKTIRKTCETCPLCQLTKRKNLKFAFLPPKEPETIPWHTLCIDLIGPYKVGVPYVYEKGKKGQPDKKKQRELHCLTMIDPATGWFEIVAIEDKRADTIAILLERHWLSRYPWPTEVVCDRGNEFMKECKDMLTNYYGLRRKPITTRNPQANAMVERAHQTLHNLIETQKLHEMEFGPEETNPEPFQGLLNSVGFAMKATAHTTLGATPMQLVFGRDAILNVGFQADWQYIKDRKQKLIIQNNKRENAKRIAHEYQVGDRVTILQPNNQKHGGTLYKGPFTIDRVYDNGTVRLAQPTKNGGVVYQQWNVRNIHPYKD